MVSRMRVVGWIRVVWGKCMLAHWTDELEIQEALFIPREITVQQLQYKGGKVIQGSSKNKCSQVNRGYCVFCVSCALIEYIMSL